MSQNIGLLRHGLCSKSVVRQVILGLWVGLNYNIHAKVGVIDLCAAHCSPYSSRYQRVTEKLAAGKKITSFFT